MRPRVLLDIKPQNYKLTGSVLGIAVEQPQKSMGYRKIKHHLVRFLIRIITVCLHIVLLKYGEKLNKIPSISPKLGHGLVLLTRVVKI